MARGIVLHPVAPGQRFGHWTALAQVKRPAGAPYDRYFSCRCDCGTEKVRPFQQLKRGGSCGCAKAEAIRAAKIRFVDLVGQQFGRLTVTRFLEYRPAPTSGRPTKRKRWWECRCACGAVKAQPEAELKAGKVKSCGCLHNETAGNRTRTHGLSKKTPEWFCWQGIVKRCENPKAVGYANYGGRGITVCERWRHDFPAFLSDMGPKPSPKHSIDRIDNSGSYSPENCRWATRTEQSRNSRHNRWITCFGKTLILADWARETGISKDTIRDRLNRGWPVERALAGSSAALPRRPSPDRSR